VNSLTAYLLSLTVTLLVAVLLTLLLKTALQKVLLDLCGTTERAAFWTRFSMIMLIATPMALALGFTPLENSSQMLFFEMMHRVRGNLIGYLFMLATTGAFISVFALFAPRPKPKDA